MALKTILNKQTDFTGEFPEEWAKGGLWRFNESDPDEDDCLLDSSGMGRAAYINNWSCLLYTSRRWCIPHSHYGLVR